MPGTIRSIHGARYCGQSVRTFANLSSPKTIGATVKTLRSSRKAWCVGSVDAAVRARVRWMVIVDFASL